MRAVDIDPGFCLFGALLLLLLPVRWVLSAVLAALVHELCHLVAVQLLGGRVNAVRIGIGGAQIQGELFGKRAVAAALAGPAGSLMLLVFCRSLPEIALCGFVQGMYNLLPFASLDGGRALELILEMCCPDHAAQISKWVEWTVLALLIGITVYGAVIMDWGLWTVFAGMIPVFRGAERKTPCKESRFGVQ